MSKPILGYEEYVEEEKEKTSKKKKKKKKKYKPDEGLTAEELEMFKRMGEDLETYLEYFDTLCICESLNPDEYKKAYKKIKELIAMLKAGAISLCVDPKRYNEFLNGEYDTNLYADFGYHSSESEEDDE